MKVPFMDLQQQYQTIKYEVNPAIQEILNSCSFIMGKSVFEFQQAFEKMHNVKYCYGTSSGTDANHLVLWALGIGPGDEVIIPANTFIATVWGATLCGAKPVFVDCDPDSYNISPEKVLKAITPKTKAIVAVHLYGQPADMDVLHTIADQNNLLLVEDAAQAHMAEYKGMRVGGLAEAGSFSFYPGKNLGAYGEAGAVVTNNEDLGKVIRMKRDQGQSQKYYHDELGHNYRMEGIQGAVLNVKMKYLSDWTEARRKAAKYYGEKLKDLDEIKLPIEMDYAKHVYHLFVVKLTNNNSDKRYRLMEFLNDNSISTGMHYPVPLHLQKCFNYLGYRKGQFPVTEDLADNCLSLPIFPEITEQQIDYVCSKLKEFFVKESKSKKIAQPVERIKNATS